MMNGMYRAYGAPEENARRLAEEQARMREALAAVRYGHSRVVLLARFLRAIAERIDPTSQSRSELES